MTCGPRVGPRRSCAGGVASEAARACCHLAAVSPNRVCHAACLACHALCGDRWTSSWLLEDHHMQRCPKCGSADTRALSPDEWTEMGVQRTLSMMAPRQCQACSVAWFPPCPLWAAGLSLAIGAVACPLLVYGALASLVEQMRARLPSASSTNGPYLLELCVSAAQLLVGGALGCVFVTYAVRVFRGTAGKLRLIEPSPAGDEPTARGSC